MRAGGMAGPRAERTIGSVYWVAEVTAPGGIRRNGKGAAHPIGEPHSMRSDRVAQAMTEDDMRARPRQHSR